MEVCKCKVFQDSSAVIRREINYRNKYTPEKEAIKDKLIRQKGHTLVESNIFSGF